MKKLLTSFALGRLMLSLALSIRATLASGKKVSYRYKNGIWIRKEAEGALANLQVQSNRTISHWIKQAESNWHSLYQPKTGDVIIDVGAGIGTDLLFWHQKIGKEGRIIAIEAQPKTFKCLQETINANGFKNVLPVEIAVGDHQGTVHIEDDEKHIGNAIKSETNGTRGVEVKLTTIEALIDELRLDRIQFLKMNIEGAERFALKGMEPILDKIDFVCISCHDFKAERTGDDFFATKKDVRQFFETAGWTIIDRPITPDKPWLNDQINATNPQPISSK